MSNFTITPVPAFNDNYIWMLIDETSQTALCVDPGDAAPVLAFLKKHHLQLSGILITHHHYDHINGMLGLKKRTKAVCYGPDDSRIHGLDKTVKEGELLNLSDLPGNFDISFQVIATPGHTLTHLCYYAAKQHWLFCGDTLFSAGCGRLFEGSAHQMRLSLSRLSQLPPETLIFCAHEYTLDNLRFAATVEPNNITIKRAIDKYSQTINLPSLPSTLAIETQINPFLRVHHPSVITYAQQHGACSKQQDEVFAILRQQKDHF